ncbi:GNAT family N-acetyltransferase [Chitinivorax sp. B]|uniref:GNAT family N-acetyltransferase n=1 Tax=Chitinivorax sp. B TaxID=2502235 RepID=UPI0010F78CB1|nr:GNAT family N-acetyltransferase [Chitinivorax sp. B]
MPTQPISLQALSHDNFDTVVKLQVHPAQRHFVANNDNTIAKAYLDHDAVLLRVICTENQPVGLLACWCVPSQQQFHLLRFMIDAQYQSLGYGQAAIRLLLDELREQHDATAVTLYYREGPGSPRPFYEKLGFSDTGERDGDEFIMRIQLSTE